MVLQEGSQEAWSTLNARAGPSPPAVPEWVRERQARLPENDPIHRRSLLQKAGPEADKGHVSTGPAPAPRKHRLSNWAIAGITIGESISF